MRTRMMQRFQASNTTKGQLPLLCVAFEGQLDERSHNSLDRARSPNRPSPILQKEAVLGRHRGAQPNGFLVIPGEARACLLIHVLEVPCPSPVRRQGRRINPKILSSLDILD
ncbi:hypothetical protein AVEN_251574-1 [Araneus ventricosus]|uniref:Uncharacterized protein n=1 Tax=Araneus ventricosus TaxID=182803 RepID=A0A4Y2FEL3_ARAVE|nr:hypothetical protein AVEN_251574-1 [Araneus ventricosus]